MGFGDGGYAGPGATGTQDSQPGNIAEAVAQAFAGPGTVGGTAAGTAAPGGADAPGGRATGTTANDIGLLGDIDIGTSLPTPTNFEAQFLDVPGTSSAATPAGVQTAPADPAGVQTAIGDWEFPADPAGVQAAIAARAAGGRSRRVAKEDLATASDTAIPSTISEDDIGGALATAPDTATPFISEKEDDDIGGALTSSTQTLTPSTQTLSALESFNNTVSGLPAGVSINAIDTQNIQGILSNPDNLDEDGNLNAAGFEALQADRNVGGVGRFSVAGMLADVGISGTQLGELASEVTTEGTPGSILNAASSALTLEQLSAQSNASNIAGQFSPNAATAIQAAATVAGLAIGGAPGLALSAVTSIGRLGNFLSEDGEVAPGATGGADVGLSGNVNEGFDAGGGDVPSDSTEVTLLDQTFTSEGEQMELSKTVIDDILASVGDLSGTIAGGVGGTLDSDLLNDPANVSSPAVIASVLAARRRILAQAQGNDNIFTGPQGLSGTPVNRRVNTLTGT